MEERRERRRKQPQNVAVGEYTESLPFYVPEFIFRKNERRLNNCIGNRFENPNLIARRNLGMKQQ